MIHLRQLYIRTIDEEITRYPFNVKAIQQLTTLEFQSPVTILVGENGSGKSTLLEALAMSIGSVVIGREEISCDDGFAAIAPLSKQIKLTWNQRTHRGFFLRAEDFFAFVQKIRILREELHNELNRIDRDYTQRTDYAKSLARGPASASLNALDNFYGEDLDAYSHGESFLTVFQSRFKPDGLYLLDEPEAALSPLRQLALISLIKQMVHQNAQFILATHSPILMAIPGASILDLDQNPPVFQNYADIDQVILFRSFLENPEAYLRQL